MLTLLPYVNLTVVRKIMTDLRRLEEKFLFPSKLSATHIYSVLSLLSVFLVNVALCFDRLTGMEHLGELRFQLTPRDARCWGYIIQFSTFRGEAKIDSLASKSSASFSTPIMEKNDLYLEMSRLQLSNGTISTDPVLSFVSEPQWPPTMARNEHVLFSIALLRWTVQLCQN